MVLNTLCGALAAYGLAGLRYTAKHIVLYALTIVLQSLIAIQLLIFSVYATPNQVRRTARTIRPCKSSAVQQPGATCCEKRDVGNFVGVPSLRV